jgi:hypothetical protein
MEYKILLDSLGANTSVNAHGTPTSATTLRSLIELFICSTIGCTSGRGDIKAALPLHGADYWRRSGRRRPGRALSGAKTLVVSSHMRWSLESLSLTHTLTLTLSH